MSTNLYELIDELCPCGVEYRALGEVCEAKRGSGLSKSIIGSGNTPVILYGQLYTTYGDYIRKIESFVDKSHVKPKSLIKPNSIVLPISSTTKEAIIGKPSVVKVEGCYLGSDAAQIIPTQDLNADFLMYVMHGYKFVHKKMKCVEGTTIRHLKVQKILDIEVPVPPMPVQAEIVRILDKFTELIATLQKELELRHKQYAYYRDLLLSPEHLYEVAGEDNVREATLGEIGEMKMCKRVLKKQTSKEGDVPFYKIGTFGGKPDAFISRELFDEYKAKYSYPSKGDLLLSCYGTLGKVVEFDGKPAYFQDSNIVWLKHDETIVLNKYLRYVYDSIEWKVETGGTIARLYGRNILSTKIIVPPLPIQRDIAQTLDKFDTLVNSLTQGIPAEIEGRKKQYAYYRDKLLDFERLEE